MRVLSVNVGAAEVVATKSGKSGIFKRPVATAVIGPLGLESDTIVDLKHHGGPDQAVYAYTRTDYDWWAQTLGRDMPDGIFGENLTLDHWPRDVIAVGDRLEMGDVVLEVTSPRIPCVTLEAHMGIKGFVTTFHNAGRPGPYFRVIAGGEVAPGAEVRVVPFKGERKRLADWPGLFGPPLRAKSDIEAWLATPVHHKMRAQLEAALQG